MVPRVAASGEDASGRTERTRSPPRALAGGEKEGDKTEETVEERTPEEERGAKKKRSDDGTAAPTTSSAASKWTYEEWEQWRKEEEEWRSRQEDRWAGWEKKHEESEGRWQERYEAQQSWQQEVALTATSQNVKLAGMEHRIDVQQEGLEDVRQATTILAQWQRDDQRDLAARQIKVTGWMGEDRPTRKSAVERWVTASESWGNYDHVRSLPGKGAGGLMPFSLITARSQDDRDIMMQKMRGFPIKSYYGNTLGFFKNIPKHMREGGHRLRFLMSCLEGMTPSKFDGKEWAVDAVRIHGEWMGAIVKTTGRKFYMCCNEAYYPVEKVAKVAEELWPTWNGYGTQSSASASSSSALTPSLTSGDARIFFLQDHAEFEVSFLSEALMQELDEKMAQRDEEAEQRATRYRGASKRWQKTPQEAEEEENQRKEEEERKEKERQEAKNTKGKLQPENIRMDTGDSSDEGSEELTSLEAHCVANHHLAKHEAEAQQAEKAEMKKKKGKANSSADAINSAKNNLGWMNDTMAREGGGWEEEEEETAGYWDNKGKWQPYNSGEYQNMSKPKGGRGGKGGGWAKAVMKKDKVVHDYYGNPHYDRWNTRNNKFEPEWEGPYGDMGNSGRWW